MPENSRIQNRHQLNQLQIEKDIEKINKTSARKRAQKTGIPLSEKDKYVELCIMGFGKDDIGTFIVDSYNKTGLVPKEILNGINGKSIPAYNTPANDKKGNDRT